MSFDLYTETTCPDTELSLKARFLVLKRMSILLGPFDDAEALKDAKEDEQLLVFGYACKLFRDDTRALLESSGQLLIPWMGDNSLMVDRYDVRNRLDDKSQFGVKSNLPYKMSAKERQQEEELDKERYLALHWDDIRVEEQEEEEKRRANENSIYSAIGFTYDDEQPSEVSPTPSATLPPEKVEPVEAEEGEEFVLPPGLVVPEGMKLPATKKLHSIIQKTAMFVCKQGTQMEIIIKTKQQSNPQFSFLDLSDPLYSYYSHLKAVLGNGSYVPPVETESDRVRETSTENGQDETPKEPEDDGVEEETSSTDENVPVVIYGPHPEPKEIKGQSSSSEDEKSDLDSGDEDGYLHPLLMQAMNPRSKSSTPTPTVPVTTKEATPPHEDVPSLSAVTFRAKSMVVNAAPELRESPVESASETTSAPTSTSHYGSHAYSGPPPQYIDSATPYQDAGHYPPDLHDGHYHHHPHMARYTHPHGPPPDQYDYNYNAYYASTSGYHTNAPPTVPIPPPDLQSIIDKTASYVVKNGSGFETTILKRHADDPRFAFLNPWGDFYSYYSQQKQILSQYPLEQTYQGYSNSSFVPERPDVQKLSSSGAVSFKLKTAKMISDGGQFAESAQEAQLEANEPPAKRTRVEDSGEMIGSTFKEFLSTVKGMFKQD